MKSIALVGAFDRDNYGDILFPLIAEEWFRKKQADFQFEYYGLVEADLRSIGGLKIKSIQSLYTEKNDGIIVVGGQILNAKWSAMHLNLINSSLVNVSAIFYKVIGKERANKLAKLILKGKTVFPWIISNDVSSGAKVVYNAVGGSSFSNYSTKELSHLKNDLNFASYLSVRGRLTYDNLLKIGIEDIKVAPDSAILLSQLFEKMQLKMKLSSHIEKTADSYENKKYICFQIGKNYGKGNEKIIAKELIRASKKFNMSLILLPIGKASGHEDHIPLLKIKNHINNQVDVELINERNIYDIMYLIANSSIFIGTSLHGCITSMSYSIPCIAMDNRVHKAEEFLREFSIESQLFSISYDQIFESIEKALNISTREIQNNTQKLIEAANENFSEIYEILK